MRIYLQLFSQNKIRCFFLLTTMILSACSTSVETADQMLIAPTLELQAKNMVTPVNTITSSTQRSEIEPALIPSQEMSSSNVPIATMTLQISSPGITQSPTPPDQWMTLPIIPILSEKSHMIFNRGIELGRNPHAFSKIGDCQSITTYFLKSFDIPGLYNLGDYGTLQATIDWFAGSFSRESLSVKGGFNAAAILSPLRSDPKLCESNENPIACEFRQHNPSIAIISLEEWWSEKPENYERYMRQIIEYSIQNGVVPILATKADNLEGNHLINQTIARLALEYDIPLWNFWLAVQPLPNHGLIKYDTSGQLDMFHLTRREGYYFFNNRVARRSGWALRNLTALQVLDAVRLGLIDQP